MTEIDLISAYIRFAEAADDSPEYDKHFWAFDEFAKLCRSEPYEAWETILAIVARNPSSRVIELLAAGPLENLLVDHGPLLIDKIEDSAKSNAKIAALLGGVWKSEMDEDVWRRIERARSHKW